MIECESAPTVVNPLSDSIQSNGKKMLILDLRHPNYFVMESKVKFEDAKTMLFSFVDSSQNWFFNRYQIWLSSYRHFPAISRVFRFFLVQGWVELLLQIYSFITSAFAAGPHIFTKVMRPLVRLQAFRIAAYLDDGLGVYPTFAECCSQSMAVKSDLFCANFVVNTQKSIWAPVQSLRWLGYRLDF